MTHRTKFPRRDFHLSAKPFYEIRDGVSGVLSRLRSRTSIDMAENAEGGLYPIAVLM